ncbi:uncharacterized protein L969DRAFT_27148, partial [Mixia osmundae IAM 14324]|uniref:uncharacterized protein n=1 Tax=Mixia osmundae (strain CBS 9802 / IAM 14324 / JCM 22182 / KY 12970) TaxID=764103 RepID=UPI0004A55433
AVASNDSARLHDPRRIRRRASGRSIAEEIENAISACLKLRAENTERRPRNLAERRDKPASSFSAASIKAHTHLQQQEIRGNAPRSTSP